MRKQFHVTYDLVTPESAEHGGTADNGFILPGDWHESVTNSPVGQAFIPILEANALTLREAVELIGLVDSSGGDSFYEVDERQNYRTGESETRALHCPDTITASSLGRVRRALGNLNLLWR